MSIYKRPMWFYLHHKRCEDLKEIKKVVKVPVGVISLKDYGLLDGSSIIKYAKQLIQK